MCSSHKVLQQITALIHMFVEMLNTMRYNFFKFLFDFFIFTFFDSFVARKNAAMMLLCYTFVHLRTRNLGFPSGFQMKRVGLNLVFIRLF